MSQEQRFTLVGLRPQAAPPAAAAPKRQLHGLPVFSAVMLSLILLGCLLSEFIMTHDPTYMDLSHCNEAPSAQFLFGTDAMGRDIFSMIWYGGRASLLIGLISTALSTLIAVVYGSLSGIAPKRLDELMMRFIEILLSVPALLVIVFLQAILGEATVLSLSLVIGLTSWTSIAKVVRTEVRQLRQSDYVVAARCMGGGFFHLLLRHLAPNFVSSIMFMVVMNVRSAIVAESTLSFMGIGLPLEVISWGSMLSLSERALMTQSWWVLLIPGLFLVATLMCITNLGNALRRRVNRRHSNL